MDYVSESFCLLASCELPGIGLWKALTAVIRELAWTFLCFPPERPFWQWLSSMD